jgi:hypothetical protein
MTARSHVVEWRWRKIHIHATVHAGIPGIGRDERSFSDWGRWTADLIREFGL